MHSLRRVYPVYPLVEHPIGRAVSPGAFIFVQPRSVGNDITTNHSEKRNSTPKSEKWQHKLQLGE